MHQEGADGAGGDGGGGGVAGEDYWWRGPKGKG